MRNCNRNAPTNLWLLASQDNTFRADGRAWRRLIRSERADTARTQHGWVVSRLAAVLIYAALQARSLLACHVFLAIGGPQDDGRLTLNPSRMCRSGVPQWRAIRGELGTEPLV